MDRQFISGSKTVILPLYKVGRNYFPFIKELEDRTIKYITTTVQYLSYTDDSIFKSTVDDLYLSLQDREGNIFVDNVNLNYFYNTKYTLGIYTKIDRKLVLQNCFIEVPAKLTGRGSYPFAVITFMYDDGRYSQKGFNHKYRKELVEILVNLSEVNSPFFGFKKQCKFPDLRTIAGKRLKSIRLANYTSGTSPLGYPVLDRNVVDSDITFSLILRNGSYILFDRLNMEYLTETDALFPLDFENVLCNFPDSSLILESPTLNFNEGYEPGTYSILLIVEYMED